LRSTKMNFAVAHAHAAMENPSLRTDFGLPREG
jgi:hypothetical protein